jgi:hypothetical protein
MYVVLNGAIRNNDRLYFTWEVAEAIIIKKFKLDAKEFMIQTKKLDEGV